jgi:sugar diacid utilization regulator
VLFRSGICINLWSRKHGEQVLPELVQAILRDEPFRMRRIAGVYNIDVASIHNMWIITPLRNGLEKPGRGREPQLLLSLIREELSPFCKTIVADIYNQDVVAFMDNPVDRDLLPLAAALSASMERSGVRALLTVCLNLKDTAQTRRAYLQNKKALDIARNIYPDKRIFTRQEIDFAESCQTVIAGGEERVRSAMAALDCLGAGDSRQTADLLETLAVFLLDADGSLDKCAARMNLHRNTIKYRINHLNGLLGFKIGCMPETMEVYTSAAVRRVLLAGE